MNRPIALCFIVVATLVTLAGGCGSGEGDDTMSADSQPAIVSPNLWFWWARQANGRYPAFALFDHGRQPPVLLVGHVPPASNVLSKFYSFEIQSQGNTIHLKSFGAFQPHGNCIAGDFEFVVSECDDSSKFPLCGALVDLESGFEAKMYSFPGWDLTVPLDWEWRYSPDPYLDGDPGEHVDLAPLLATIDDAHYQRDRSRSTSRFLRGAFDTRANLRKRLEEPALVARRCEDSGRGILKALAGTKGFSFISSTLPGSSN